MVLFCKWRKIGILVISLAGILIILFSNHKFTILNVIEISYPIFLVFIGRKE